MLSYRRFSLTWLSIPPQKKRFCSRSVDYPRRSLHCSRGGLARCFCTLTSGFTIISTNVNPKTANFERTNSTQKTQQNYVYINTILQSKTERFESGLFALFFFFTAGCEVHTLNKAGRPSASGTPLYLFTILEVALYAQSRAAYFVVSRSV